MRRQGQTNKAGINKRTLLLGAMCIFAQAAQAQPQMAPADAKLDVLQVVPQIAANAGTAAVAQTSERKILISLLDRKLALIEDGKVLKVYPIAVGKRDTPSPAGEFKVINRLTNPTWYGGEKPVPAGPENPLGTRWMGLSKKGYGIHGTNTPTSIGKRASHGCIRMAQADLEELFELVRVGGTVVLEGMRTAEVAAVFAVPVAPAAQPVVAAAPVMLTAAPPLRNF